MVLVLADLARERPTESGLRDGSVDWLWEELNQLLNRAVHALQGTPGRVAVMAENSAESLLAHTALLFAGVSAVPVNAHLTATEAEYLLAIGEVSLVLACPRTRPVAADAAARVGARLVSWRTDGSWEALLAASSDSEPAHDHRPAPPLMFTSGTTGRPKATEIPPTMFPVAADIPGLLAGIRAHGLHGLGRHLVVGPLHHTGPLSAARLLAVGNPVTVLGRFDATRLLEVVERDRIATSVMVPTHFVRLLAVPDRDRFDVSSLRSVAQTGASCPVEVKRQMIEWWGPVLVESYGATEVGVVSAIESDEWLRHPGSVGRPVPPFEALVLDEGGQPCPTGTPGELWFRDTTGRGLVYAHTPEAFTPRTDGLFTLGEAGYVDDDGYLYITDRVSDMVVSGGVNIYPAEVENVLVDHPGVHDAGGIGLPDPDLGERLVVLVELADPQVTPAELIDWCRGRLAHYKCPREVVVVPALPRTTMGKLDKRALRASHLASA